MQEEIIMLRVIFSATLFIALFGIIVMGALIRISIRKRKILLEKQELERRFQQELLQAGMEMQEYTFRAISREIHDNAGQILSLAKLNLNIICMEHTDTKKILDVKALVSQAIDELKALGIGYHAEPLMKKGLIAAIAHQVALLQKTGLFTVRFNTDFDLPEVNQPESIFIYRIVQESIHNIIRHSGASVVSVDIRKQQASFTITIADNGKGFNYIGAGFEPGIGLSSMVYRASIIGAHLEIKSAEKKGTIISLTCKQNQHD